MKKKKIGLAAIFAMRAHGGWLHALLSKARSHRAAQVFAPTIDIILRALDSYTQKQSAQFDRRYGTRTYGRLDVSVGEDKRASPVWGYSAINHDFFREMMQAVPVALKDYSFVDIGAGKGAAVLMASEFPFRRLIGVELNHELVVDALENTRAFNQNTGQNLSPQWDEADFFKWQPPAEPCLFFFNNPFPEALTLTALKHLESLLLERRQRAILVFRKMPRSSAEYVNQSTVWMPLKLAAYWRIYAIN